MNDIYVCLTNENLNLIDVMQKIQNDDCGAIDIFVGTVRNNHNGKIVTGITYDAHQEIAEKTFKEICGEGKKIWPETKYALYHFKGELLVGGISVIIAVASPHRAESFDACRYVIEEIKKRAPIWKREHYEDGKSDWLPGHSLNEKS